MTEAANVMCWNWNPSQVCAFVCSSRAKNAQVTEVHIGYDIAKRHARMIGGVMRVGRVVNGMAHTI
jgi:hypothetical protein